MLGSLARWLRILGYDTLYCVDLPDDELRFKASETGRILLTRDNELVQRTRKLNIPVIQLHSEVTVDQIREVYKALNLDLSPKNTRCPRCNGILFEKDKKRLLELVPEKSYETFDIFWQCRSCNSIYWRGSHWSQIIKTLESVSGSKCL